VLDIFVNKFSGKYIVSNWNSFKAFFAQVGEAVLPLILGKNYTVNLQKGKKKLDVNSIFWENCMILKNFSLGKQPNNGPCYRRKKALSLKIKHCVYHRNY
jgi:hypothetical protein